PSSLALHITPPDSREERKGGMREGGRGGMRNDKKRKAPPPLDSTPLLSSLIGPYVETTVYRTTVTGDSDGVPQPWERTDKRNKWPNGGSFGKERESGLAGHSLGK
ncbi:hypothetical protein KUCAC02_005747, partial [Chaenocephalus aceratus]